MISPSCMSHIGTRPPSGVNESCIALTEPFDAPSSPSRRAPMPAMPKRTSLPSMLPPACSALAAWSTGSDASAGLPACSCETQSQRSGRKIDEHRGEHGPALARVLDHLAERVAERRRDQRGSRSISTKFESGVGFSNGCAEFALKKPPPFVPSCLIAICDAAGPSART